MFRASSRAFRALTTRLYLDTLRATLALFSIIRRLMEYRASWVNMPARIAGMPINVCSRPVTSPASMPASTATSMATQTSQPPIMSMAATAPPVAMEPSTVRSATSRIL